MYFPAAYPVRQLAQGFYSGNLEFDHFGLSFFFPGLFVLLQGLNLCTIHEISNSYAYIEAKIFQVYESLGFGCDAKPVHTSDFFIFSLASFVEPYSLPWFTRDSTGLA